MGVVGYWILGGGLSELVDIKGGVVGMSRG